MPALPARKLLEPGRLHPFGQLVLTGEMVERLQDPTARQTDRAEIGYPDRITTAGGASEIMLWKRNPVALLVHLTDRVVELDRASRVDFAMELIERSGLDYQKLECLLGNLSAAFAKILRRGHESEADKIFCSFCHRRQDEVRALVTATQAAICDECAAIVLDTIEESYSADQ